MKKTGKQVAATLQTDINAPIEAVFDFVAAEEVLPKALTGYDRTKERLTQDEVERIRL
jgi:hypothetical protein